MDKIRIIHFIFWVTVVVLVSASWNLENERVARILLGLAIELTFIYAAHYGGAI